MLELATDPCLVLSARASPTWQITYLGCTRQDKFTMGQQCALASFKKASGILGAQKGDHPPPLLCPGGAAPGVLHQFWAPQPKKDKELMQRVHWSATKIIRGLKHLAHGDKLGLFSLEKRLRGNLIRAQNIFRTGVKKVGPDSL